MRRLRVAVQCLLLAMFSLQLFGQVPSCPTGALADVLGTTCSVGSMIFTFKPDFSGAPAALQNIRFQPVQSGDQSGFTLGLDFTDLPGTFGVHFVQFSYLPQAAPGFEIRAQNLSMDAFTQGAPPSSAFAQILDFQDYVHSGFVAADTAIDNENGELISNQLTDNHILQVPGLFSTGFPGSQTTQIFDFSSGAGLVVLSSATFLYTSGPIVPAPDLAPLSYSTIDLPGVLATFASNITNSGQIVGSYQDVAGHFHGYVEQPQGSFVTVDVPGAVDTFADGLNERGDVAGTFTDAAGQTHGFLQRDGAFTTLDVPGSLFTGAIAINDKDQIVGEYESADQGFHGFLLNQGVFTTLDQGPETGFFASTQAFAVNNAGEVGGTFFDPDTFRSFLLKNGAFTDFDVPGQGNTLLEGLNTRGDSVGAFDDINLIQHGFVLSNGIFNTVDVPGGSNTFALGINATGKIVGQYSANDGSSHSFLATPVPGDGHDHSPQTGAGRPSGPMPDCSDPAWHRQRDQLRNAGPCQVKH